MNRQTLSRGGVIALSLLLLNGCLAPAENWVRHEVESESSVTGTSLALKVAEELTTANLRALDQFRDDWLRRPGERLQLSAAAGSEPAAIEAAQWLAARGMAPALKRDPVLPAGTIHLGVVRYQTHIPQCGTWDKARESNFSNAPAHDFGCSNARNLGLMVADPADLAAPGGVGAGTGLEAAAAIERYRSFHDEAASSNPVNILLGGSDSGGTQE